MCRTSSVAPNRSEQKVMCSEWCKLTKALKKQNINITRNTKKDKTKAQIRNQGNFVAHTAHIDGKQKSQTMKENFSLFSMHRMMLHAVLSVVQFSVVQCMIPYLSRMPKRTLAAKLAEYGFSPSV